MREGFGEGEDKRSEKRKEKVKKDKNELKEMRRRGYDDGGEKGRARKIRMKTRC